MNLKSLILVRGLPGSGKSTLSMLLSSKIFDSNLLSTDMFFEDKNGNYNFDASKLKEAHQWCNNQCEQLMIDNTKIIFVANTFTQNWEMEKYYELAKKYNYQVYSIIVENRHGNKNQHNVPEEIIEKMKKRFEIKF